jgi:hypothetical protein
MSDPTEAQIEAEINRRLAEESKQGDAEAMPAIDYKSTQAKLLEAEKALRDAEQQNKSAIPGVDIAKSIYNDLPQDIQPYALGTAGYLGGKVLRSALPQEKVMGTNEFINEQNKREALLQSKEPAHRAYVEANNTAFETQENHQARANMLAQQHALAQQQHEAALEELRRAQMQHAHAQTLSVDEEMARRAPAMGITGPSALPARLTPQPIGGEGTASYAMKFGATPEEAARVASMSNMQQQNIPAQAQAWQKINQIAPGFQQVSESPILLGPEGQKSVAERVGNMTAEERHRIDLEAQHKKHLAEQLAKHKATVQFELDRAQKEASARAQAAADALKAHHKHVNIPAVTPEQLAKRDTSQHEYADILKRIEQTNPSMLARLGRVAGRFVPGAGAAFAPIEASAAKKAFDEQQYLRAATHGLGALGGVLQSTAIPPLVGAGDLMQIPAAGLSIYDLANAKKSGQQ